jgi:hypothetical protein
MLGKKKMCLIVKSEETFGISLWVNQDFDEEYNSPVMKKLLKDFPKSKRKVIFPQRDEVEMMNEGEMKNEPQFYLNKDGVVKSLTV